MAPHAIGTKLRFIDGAFGRTNEVLVLVKVEKSGQKRPGEQFFYHLRRPDGTTTGGWFEKRFAVVETPGAPEMPAAKPKKPRNPEFRFRYNATFPAGVRAGKRAASTVPGVTFYGLLSQMILQGNPRVFIDCCRDYLTPEQLTELRLAATKIAIEL